jgi:prophage regulatory protein
MLQDMLDMLRLDLGSRTMGQLMQEREWAYGEIMRLRREIARLTQHNSPRSIAAQPISPVPMPNTDPMLDKHRLIRLPEVRRLVGLSHSSIYRLVSQGRFPVPLKISERAVRWRYADILEWQARAADDL